MTLNSAEEIRSQIGNLVGQYYEVAFKNEHFVPGQTAIPVSGRVFDQTELRKLVESSLDFWLTTGRFADTFEEQFSKYVGVDYALLVNSGSSANLLAITALTSSNLGDRRLKPGDEVITVAAGFPTTVNPIIQNNLVPVFVDVDIPTYNTTPEKIEQALGPKTKAIILAHTLGNPFDAQRIKEIAERNNLWLIEDCCDALGTTINGKMAGSFGDLATYSFYPAHHITMGEGGCVTTYNTALKHIVRSLRDWGRDCWCDPGNDNCCGNRYAWRLGDLPEGYDHKYIYSHIGYNLKLTDMQAAVGVAQLKKLNRFIQIRKHNFETIYRGLEVFSPELILPEPLENSEPAWFGFPITISATAPFSRAEILTHLNASKIGTRLLFGGNLIKQPAYRDADYRVSGNLQNTDLIMESTFWIGNYPKLDNQMLDYLIGQFEVFMKAKLS